MSTENEQANLVNNVEEDDGYTKPASMIEKDSGDNTKRNAAAAGAGVVVLGAGAVAASVLLAPAALVGAGVLTGIGAYKYSKNNDKLAQEGSLSHVHLEIKSATGLKEGTNAFAKLKIGSLKAETFTIPNNENPTWNQTLEIRFVPERDSSVSLEVFDKTATRESSIGTVKIDLKEIVASRSEEKKDYDLPLKGGKKESQLHLTMWLTYDPEFETKTQKKVKAEQGKVDKAAEKAAEKAEKAAGKAEKAEKAAAKA
eukprot:TRINITY_DN335_c0_g1_i4.p1 TRINITY_DN335_c0_g1~~TRINITY_DN335_c0_g1_i4.p1  ORF type:complete len:256 (+),score=164.59 TRINITY_DN335_c0_g1_i4:43-810(+)